MKTKTTIAALSLIALASAAPAASVAGWVSIFDPQANNPRFVGTTASTASPVTTDADQDSIAANFPTVTLADGDSITLTGSVAFDVELAGNQFRVGLFDGATVVQDVGNPYIGIYSEAPTASSSSLKYGPGTHDSHLFGSGSVIADNFLPAGGSVSANTPISFSLTITRDGANLDVATSYSTAGAYGTSATAQDVDILSTAPGYNYTYNTAAFLMGGSMNGNKATFSDIDVTYVPEPSSALLGLLGLGLIRRRRA